MAQANNSGIKKQLSWPPADPTWHKKRFNMPTPQSRQLRSLELSFRVFFISIGSPVNAHTYLHVRFIGIDLLYKYKLWSIWKFCEYAYGDQQLDLHSLLLVTYTWPVLTSRSHMYVFEQRDTKNVTFWHQHKTADYSSLYVCIIILTEYINNKDK